MGEFCTAGTGASSLFSSSDWKNQTGTQNSTQGITKFNTSPKTSKSYGFLILYPKLQDMNLKPFNHLRQSPEPARKWVFANASCSSGSIYNGMTARQESQSSNTNCRAEERDEWMADKGWLTLSSFISPSSCTISSLLLSWSADILCSNSSFLCLFQLHERKSQKTNFELFQNHFRKLTQTICVFHFHHSPPASNLNPRAKHSTRNRKPMQKIRLFISAPELLTQHFGRQWEALVKSTAFWANPPCFFILRVIIESENQPG